MLGKKANTTEWKQIKHTHKKCDFSVKKNSFTTAKSHAFLESKYKVQTKTLVTMQKSIIKILPFYVSSDMIINLLQQ